MDATLAELERVQTQILSRISNLELSLLPHNPLPSLSPFYSSPGANGDGDSDRDTGTVARLSNILRSNGVNNFSFKRVPADYYDRSLECRRDLLGAASIDHLCKSIVLSFSLVLTDKLVANIVHYAVRLAPEDTSIKLTGYEHNAVTCIGMNTDIPVILDEAIVELNPDFFWLGGGEVDLKLGIKTSEFINFVKPFIVNCSGN
ncbi:LOW QUALITY PROTEIN: uncharacterized protein LOC110826140 [Carica papaya]|uniref:LOW QUALITY PROTEIN: uncharacterized protein LOC110826140 n=1 Tax=Carica papaya TaxID=3649 RepID=UPI000B8D1331|nr:LOW QUALITY PROTEIN: uncharacterized protein LOC110826140 [Carica papaya]